MCIRCCSNKSDILRGNCSFYAAGWILGGEPEKSVHLIQISCLLVSCGWRQSNYFNLHSVCKYNATLRFSPSRNLCKCRFFTHSLDLSGSERKELLAGFRGIMYSNGNATLCRKIFLSGKMEIHIVSATRPGEINWYFVCCSFLVLRSIYRVNPFR